MNKFDSIYNFYKTVTSRFGYDWILGYYNPCLGRQKLLFVIMVGFLFLNSFQMTASLTKFESFGVWAVCVILFASAFFSCSAALLLVVHGKQIGRMINWCKNLYVANIDTRLIKTRNDLFMKCARETLFLSKAVYYGFKLILTSLFVSPIPMYFVTGRIMLPVTFHFPGLPYDQLKYYLLNYFSQFFGVYCAVNVTLTLNSMLVMVLLHTKYQFDLIDESIKLTINRVGLDLKENVVGKALEAIIKMHSDVLSIVKLASKVFSLQILLFNMVTYFIIGFTYVSTQLDKSLLYFSVVSFVCIFYLGIISLLGSLLHERSMSIATAIYCTNWYNLDIKHQKTLQLVMLRSQKSKPLSAAGFADLSLVSFLNLLYRSYSFCALAHVVLSKKGF